MEDPTYSAVLSEWEGVTARERRIAGTSASTLALMQAEERELRDAGRWVSGRTDVLGITGTGRRELSHSAMLAWLLTPEGTHGLGTGFLQRVLLRVAPTADTVQLHRARVSCELERGDTRADLVVEAPGVLLVIENKVDASEQPAQCDRLYRCFSGTGSHFAFLTPRGLAPTTATGPAQGAFCRLAYPDLRKDLRDALDSPAANVRAPGRAAAEDYVRTLTTEFT